MNITLKPINKTTEPLLRTWRNQNRHHFLDSSYITNTQHQQWLTSQAKDPTQVTYVIHYKEKPVGTIGATIKPNAIQIERVMLGDKSLARQGITSIALKLLLQKHPSTRYYLQVLITNLPAIKFYQKHGFQIIRSKDNYNLMEKTSQAS